MRLVFAGTPAVALPALDAIAASSHDLVAVVSRPDAPSGRGRQLVPSPVSAWAASRGIPVLTPARPREPEFLRQLAELEPDCCPVVAYGALVPRAALDIPRYGWINLHFSLLPAWRGAAPVQHAVLHGDDMTGASVFLLEEGLDTGPVFGTLTDPVGPRDTSGDLLDRLAVSGADLLVQVLDGIEAHAVGAVPQPHEGISTAPKLTVEDAHVRWGDPAFAVDRRVRACTPAPGAWTTLHGDRLKLGPVTPLTAASVIGAGTALAPGVVAVERNRVLVGTGTVPVVLGTVTAPGKKAMPADAWARGARIETGTVLGTSAVTPGVTS
ncbi:methionyl-tRNA formyltransferase [Dactylosporangium sp. NPDC049525]|uniref:methionyl-tRNA formyltransferase n=1 Tax=Dactylosporangium sp. NPDC049525 TaxID=3154730 RepID=UPI003446F399